jgi:hypothetical protein
MCFIVQHCMNLQNGHTPLIGKGDMMKKLLTLLMLLPSLAWGATYHVRPGGSDGDLGTTWKRAWQTIGKANTAARPGDLIYVYDNAPNTYTHFPNPDSGGSNPSGKITFVGASLSGDPITNKTTRNNIRINGCLIKNHVVIKGMTFTGELQVFSPAQRDSIVDCTINGNVSIQQPDYIYITRCDILGKKVRIGSIAITSDRITKDVKFNSCTFPNLESDATEAFFTGKIVPGMRTGTLYVDSLQMWFNQITIRTTGKATAALRRHCQTSKSTFRGNRWNCFNSSGKGQTWITTSVRDSSHRVFFKSDTILAHGTLQHNIVLGEVSTWGRAFQNRVDSCFFSVSTGVPAWYQTQMDRDTLTYNVFVTNSGPALWTPAGWLGKNLVDHNTFAAKSLEFANSDQRGVVAFAQGPFSANGDTTKFYSNLLYDFPCTGSNCGFADRRNLSKSKIHGLFISSVANKFYPPRLYSQWNCYAIYPHVTNTFDRAVGWIDSVGNYRTSQPGGGKLWANTYVGTGQTPGMDSLSVGGTALFAAGGTDTSFAQFDPRIGKQSAARGVGKDGTDAGAKTYVGTPIVTLSHTSLSFFQDIGVPDTTDITLCNVGDALLSLSNLAVSNSQRITASFQADTLSPTLCKYLRVIYNPTQAEPPVDTVTFTTNAANIPEARIEIRYYLPPGPGGPGRIGAD